MKIAVLLTEAYPVGMACTNRTHLYCKGLVEVGNDVRILIPQPTESQDHVRNSQKRGVFEGVRFTYANGSVKANGFLKRRIQNSISLLNTILFFFKFRPEVILIVSNNFKYTLLGFICSFFLNTKLVREKTKVPFYKKEYLSTFLKFRIRSEFRLFDGLIVISENLKSFFRDDIILKRKIFVMPILIDTQEPMKASNNERIDVQPTLVYTGSLLDHKDGVVTILRAFGRIKKNFPNMQLVMSGELESSADKDKILSTIQFLNLQQSVKFTGYIEKDRLIELRNNASALVLAKPSNRQNYYNMATKIGEYLLSGRPIVISCVDPISQYLTNKIDAFITEPNEHDIANQVNFILNNLPECSCVGKNGRETAINFFDYKKHVVRLADFFHTLSAKE